MVSLRGIVFSYSDGMAKIQGAYSAFYGELRIGCDNRGVVCSLEKNHIVLAFFSKSVTIKPGYQVARTNSELHVKVGPHVLNTLHNATTLECLGGVENKP